MPSGKDGGNSGTVATVADQRRHPGKPAGTVQQRPPRRRGARPPRRGDGLSDLLAAVTGEGVLPPLEEDDPATPGGPDGGSATKTRVTLGEPRLIEWLRWPIEDRAYQLYLRGYSVRQIGRVLECSKDIAARYVRDAKREQALWRREKREAWLDETIARLRNIQRQAWARWDESGDPMLLNTITRVEVEIAKLRGLYEVVDSATGAGVSIMITHRGPQATIDGTVEHSETVDEAEGATDGEYGDGTQ